MAFDSGFLAAVVCELRERVAGGRIDKIQQPSKDEILLGIRADGRNEKLLIAVGANNPRINLTSLAFENPAVPFGFCQLLRKHISGAKISSINQLGFERALEIELETRDEMGFSGIGYLIVEIMGKYSNMMLCNSDRRIIQPLRPVDFTTSHKRQVLAGMSYELPPTQNKIDPMTETPDGFSAAYGDTAVSDDKFLTGRYMGISSLTAREISYRAESGGGSLASEFFRVVDMIRGGDFTPVVLFDESGKPFEYSFFDIEQYGGFADKKTYPDFGSAIDEFFEKREQTERVKQKASDIIRLISNAEARLKKKLLLLREDLAKCAEKDKFKLYGDLITANIYRLKRFRDVERLPDYSSGVEIMVSVRLDRRLSASQNAQKYYKKYSKLKTGEIEISKQIRIAEEELEYIRGIKESLNMAENEADLNDIRRELHKSGYASRMKSGSPSRRKSLASRSAPAEYRTSNGYTVLCGKNNTQNDELTFHTADKNDWWFHVKNAPGSHVVMICSGEEPPAEDFTEAAVIAATCSSQREGKHVEVDYTQIRNIRKPSSAKPGFVIYKTNYSATVDPDERFVKKIRVK
ncbi:MAG: NFACT family protein [Clostridia bacterium]|nr:NFACT family protein [Clostridia bacterium]